jgi:hypothetical protein
MINNYCSSYLQPLATDRYGVLLYTNLRPAYKLQVIAFGLYIVEQRHKIVETKVRVVPCQQGIAGGQQLSA